MDNLEASYKLAKLMDDTPALKKDASLYFIAKREIMQSEFDSLHDSMQSFVTDCKSVCNPKKILKIFDFELHLPDAPFKNALVQSQIRFEKNCNSFFGLADIMAEQMGQAPNPNVEDMKNMAIKLSDHFTDLIEVAK